MKLVSGFNKFNTVDRVVHRLSCLQTLGIIVCLALAAFLCTSQLFMHQSLPVAHDMVFHVFQADQFIRALDSGAMLPRWAMSSNGGYGSPNFIFYAPLGYYLTALIHLFVPSLTVTMILVVWCGFFFSGMSMLFAAKKLTGEAGSLVAAVTYQLLPFHLSDLYMRGTFSELLAFPWFPLILLFLHENRVSNGSCSAPVGLALSYTGLILTHLVSGFIFTLVVALYLAWDIVFRDKKSLRRTMLYSGLGLGIASFYIIPAIFEQKFIQTDYIYDYVFSDFRKNFLFLANDFREGFGHFKYTLNLTALLELALFVLLAAIILRARNKTPKGDMRAFFILLFAAAFFLTTPLSKPLWELLPGFPTLQFPWRWMGVMELSLCFLIGAGFSSRTSFTQGNTLSRLTGYLLAALLCISAIIVFKSTRMHSGDFLARIVDPEQAGNYKNLPKEYTPIWAINLEKMLAFEEIEKVAVFSGASRFSVTEWQPERRVMGIDASSPSLLRVSTFYYPGWEAEIDGQKTSIGIEKGTGIMLVEIPRGKHTLVLKFSDTPLRLMAKYLSLGAFLTLLLCFAIKKKRETKSGTNCCRTSA